MLAIELARDTVMSKKLLFAQRSQSKISCMWQNPVKCFFQPKFWLTGIWRTAETGFVVFALSWVIWVYACESIGRAYRYYLVGCLVRSTVADKSHVNGGWFGAQFPRIHLIDKSYGLVISGCAGVVGIKKLSPCVAVSTYWYWNRKIGCLLSKIFSDRDS